MSIYPSREFPFVPTYLYIKQHSITGKLYFGKTIQNPLTYRGSGFYWSRHIKKHKGKFVVTLWYCLFHDAESIKEFALGCSDLWDIVKSKDWLNFKPENGLDGGVPGIKFSVQHCENMRKANLGKIMSDISKEKNRIAHLGIPKSEECKRNISIGNTGKIRTEQQCKNMSNSIKHLIIKTCPHCGLIGSGPNMTRFHFDKCSIEIVNRRTRIPHGPRRNLIIKTCPYCGLIGGGPNMTRFHFDKCKLKSDTTSMNITTNK